MTVPVLSSSCANAEYGVANRATVGKGEKVRDEEMMGSVMVTIDW